MVSTGLAGAGYQYVNIGKTLYLIMFVIIIVFDLNRQIPVFMLWAV